MAQQIIDTTVERNPTDPKRVRAFAAFFKRYMSISSLVVASLPIPATSLHLIPTFTAQTKLLSVYTSLFCFLTLGFIFYSRHQLARLMFPHYFDLLGGMIQPYFGNMSEEEKAFATAKYEREQRRERRREMVRNSWRRFVVALPLVFIAASLVLVFQYNDVLNLNVQELTQQSGVTDFKYIPEHANLNDIRYSSRLMILYIAIFVTAEAAFIMMAIEEYLQDLVGLDEMDLIRGYRINTGDNQAVPAEKFVPAETELPSNL